MQYKSLNQSQIRVTSTIDTTINISNDLTKLDWGTFSGPAAIVVSEAVTTPTASTPYNSTGSTFVPFDTISNTANPISIGFAHLTYASGTNGDQVYASFLAIPQSHAIVDGVLYYGYKMIKYRGATIYTAKNATKQYVMPKGVLKIIMYDNAADTIITKEFDYAGKARTTTTAQSGIYFYSAFINITKNTDDIILGTFFEAEPITVTKNLTGCTATDNTTNNKYNFGQPYTIEVKPTSGHTLTGSIISFTADGVAIPSAAYAWDETDGICTINPIYVSNTLVVNVNCPIS